MNIDQLVGRFHAHFTVPISDPSQAPHVSGFKKTVIDLQHRDRAQTDVMYTRYYQTVEPGVSALKQRVYVDTSALKAVGLPVSRAKLEYEGEFSGELTETNYLEAHIKTLHRVYTYEHSLAVLLAEADRIGYRLSRNPLESRGDEIRHFANIRIKCGQTDRARETIAFVCGEISASGIDIEHVKIELNVWDTTPTYDNWWA